jgi:hypothetical protein
VTATVQPHIYKLQLHRVNLHALLDVKSVLLLKSITVMYVVMDSDLTLNLELDAVFLVTRTMKVNLVLDLVDLKHIEWKTESVYVLPTNGGMQITKGVDLVQQTAQNAQKRSYVTNVKMDSF